MRAWIISGFLSCGFLLTVATALGDQGRALAVELW